jgi:hypothetical protein
MFVSIGIAAALAEEPAEGTSESRAKIEKALDAPIRLHFVETPLVDVQAFLQSKAKIPVHLDRRALDEVGLGDEIPITFALEGVTLRSALRHMLGQHDLTTVTRDEMLVVTTPEGAENLLTVRVYPVRDLAQSTDANGRQFEDFDPLIELFTGAIQPNNWDEVGGPGSLAGHRGLLVVSQHDDVHQQLAAWLAALRKLPRYQDAPADKPTPGPVVFVGDHPPGNAKIHKALRDQTTFDFLGTPLNDVVDYFGSLHEFPVLIDARALEDVGVKIDTQITAHLEGARLAAALRTILRELDLTYAVRDEVLLVTTPEQVENKLVEAIYPIADLLKAEGVQTPADVAQELADLQRLIENTVDPNTWGEVGGPGAFHPLVEYGAIAVVQTPSVHDKVAKLLTQVRAAQKSQATVPRPQSAANAKVTRVYVLTQELSAIEPAELEELIREVIAPDEWNDGALVKAVPGRVVVRHKRHVQKQISELLLRLAQQQPNLSGGEGHSTGGIGEGGGFFRPR